MSSQPPPRRPKPPSRKKQRKRKQTKREISPAVLIASCVFGSFFAVVVGALLMKSFNAPTVADNSSESASNAQADSEGTRTTSSSQQPPTTTNTEEKTNIPSAPLTATTAEGTPTHQTETPELPPKSTGENQGADTVASSSETSPKQPMDDTGKTQPADNAPKAAPEAKKEVVVTGPVDRVQDDSPVVPPPIPLTITSIGKDDFSSIRKKLRKQHSAANAFILYKAFSESYEFSEFQQKRVDEELEQWKERSGKNLFRLGTEWVSKDLVDKATSDSSRLVNAGLENLVDGNYTGAIALFDQASHANPNGIRADYTAGLIFSLFAKSIGPEKAEYHFGRVVNRDSNYGPALNSLAIAQVKQRHYLESFRSFQMASDSLSKCPEVVHNVSRFLGLARRNRLSPSKPILKKYEELYAKLIAAGKGESLGPRIGWLHIPPVFSVAEREEEIVPAAQESPLKDDSFVHVSNGSGFLVAPNYYLTNRHVAKSEDRGVADRVGVHITEAGKQTVEKFGNVVAISDKTDLALLHVPEATGIPFQILDEQLAHAGEVLILGYPIPDLFGSQLKVTQGIVASLPDSKRTPKEPYYYFDAIADHGNSGGPILDRHGRVGSILTTGFSGSFRGQEITANFTGGVPSTDALDFLNEHLPDYDNTLDAKAQKAEWSELVAKYAPSVVQVKVYYKSGTPPIAKSSANEDPNHNVLEDRACVTCNGRALLPCRAKGCLNGNIKVTKTRSGEVGLGVARRVARVAVFSTVDCKECQRGMIDCPACVDGLDNELRGKR